MVTTAPIVHPSGTYRLISVDGVALPAPIFPSDIFGAQDAVRATLIVWPDSSIHGRAGSYTDSTFVLFIDNPPFGTVIRDSGDVYVSGSRLTFKSIFGTSKFAIATGDKITITKEGQAWLYGR